MNEAREIARKEPEVSAFRFGMRSVLIGSVVLAVVFAGYAWFYRTIIVPKRHTDQLEALINSLIDRRPSEMSRGQWGSAVGWTMNLHANSLIMHEADATSIADFVQRVKIKLSGEVSMETIHWIWDEYGKICKHGAKYQRFKKQMLDEMAKVGPNDDVWGTNVR